MFFYDKELNFFIFRFLSLFILLPGTVPTTYKVAVFQILRHYFAHPLSLPVRSESSGLKVKKMQTNLKKNLFNCTYAKSQQIKKPNKNVFHGIF